jgi:hypothetical protein
VSPDRPALAAADPAPKAEEHLDRKNLVVAAVVEGGIAVVAGDEDGRGGASRGK